MTQGRQLVERHRYGLGPGGLRESGRAVPVGGVVEPGCGIDGADRRGGGDCAEYSPLTVPYVGLTLILRAASVLAGV